MLLSNRYQVLETLGAGGFGTTFLAEDIQMPSRRKCVIKQLKPINDNPQIYKLVQERFQREAVILENVGNTHDQIPDLYAYFEEGGKFYLIQEWVEGGTLGAKVEREGPQSEETVRQILTHLLPVLNFIHSKQIIHRDIKPDNIILRKLDNMPVLIDFGAVREAMGTMVNSQGGTASSIVIGTPGFMPSEQAAGRPVYSSDLYSLGLTMIYLLAGRYPQELDFDPTTGDILWQKYVPSLSPSFAAILDRMIQYHPRDRYPSAQDILLALQQGNFPSGNAVTVQAPIRGSYSTEAPPTVITPASTVQQPQSLAAGDFNAQPIGNSGQGALKEVPPEVPGWNWGAFLLPGLWSINNQVWVGLASWSGCLPMVPLLGWFAGGFVVGVKGNEWAWKSRPWRSLEEFKRNQKHWAIAGFITWGGMIVSIAAILYFAPPPEETASSVSPDTPSSAPAESPIIDPFSGSADSTTSSSPLPTVFSGVASSDSPSVGSNSYPEADIQAFMDSCIPSAIDAGATPEQANSYCTCTITSLQEQYTYEEYQGFTQQVNTTQQMPEALQAIIDLCNQEVF